MAIPSFYCPELSLDILDLDEPIIALSANESGHAVRSRRLRQGQSVNLLNGCGVVGEGTLHEIGKREVLVSVKNCTSIKKASCSIAIATAIPKGDRQKVMVDMLTQLGVEKIIPLESEHSITRYSDNLRDKWQRAAIESCKQSQNPWLPIIEKGHCIDQLMSFDDYHLSYTDFKGSNMNEIISSGVRKILVIIGPEGGLSNREMSLLDGEGVAKISLAKHILRTEAAAITAAAQFNQLNVSLSV